MNKIEFRYDGALIVCNFVVNCRCRNTWSTFARQIGASASWPLVDRILFGELLNPGQLILYTLHLLTYGRFADSDKRSHLATAVGQEMHQMASLNTPDFSFQSPGTPNTSIPFLSNALEEARQ